MHFSDANRLHAAAAQIRGGRRSASSSDDYVHFSDQPFGIGLERSSIGNLNSSEFVKKDTLKDASPVFTKLSEKLIIDASTSRAITPQGEKAEHHDISPLILKEKSLKESSAELFHNTIPPLKDTLGSWGRCLQKVQETSSGVAAFAISAQGLVIESIGSLGPEQSESLGSYLQASLDLMGRLNGEDHEQLLCTHFKETYVTLFRLKAGQVGLGVLSTLPPTKTVFANIFAILKVKSI